MKARPWVRVNQIHDHLGEEITVKGWLQNKRSSGKVQFLLLRDGTGVIQGVMGQKDVPAETFDLTGELTQESSLIATGVVRRDSRAPGGYELLLSDLKLVHRAEEYPLSPKEHGPDFLLSHRHLWLRSGRQRAIMMIRAEMIRAVKDFLDSQGFIQLDAPILTPTVCEGTTTLFSTQYFDQGQAYLTQSGQFYAEAGALALGKVYTFGPTFRAEKSKTRRHLTEFWMIEPEAAFTDLDDLMDLAEDLIAYFISRVLEARKEEFKVLERDTSGLEKVKRPFVRLTYDQALKNLDALGHSPVWGQDLGAPEETALSENYDLPILIHRYPKEAKAFYMKTDPQDPRLALCLDVLAPEGYGEIVGGSQREDDLKVLIERMEQEGVPVGPLEWYLDLRRYGTVPHSGFGLGLERSIAWVCGLKHVREAIPFPRMIDRCYP
ncbi:MAG: asparagine--tRNA ligase [Pseudomonadota bacterium]